MFVILLKVKTLCTKLQKVSEFPVTIIGFIFLPVSLSYGQDSRTHLQSRLATFYAKNVSSSYGEI
jgi:hypothetical protein